VAVVPDEFGLIDRRPVILFLASRRNCIQVMAEGLVRAVAPGNLNVISASLAPAELIPAAIQAMAEVGIDISILPVRSPLDIEVFLFDLVITLGDFDQSCRPTLPLMPPHLHWDMPDPSSGIDAPLLLNELRNARDTLQGKLKTLFESGIINALTVSRRNFELILDNLREGVVAHTRTNRIFYFNKAAEAITGYSREDLLGRDWPDVFAGTAEAWKSLTMGGLKNAADHLQEVEFRRPDGTQRILETRSMPLQDVSGSPLGVLLTFKDNTELHALKNRLRHHHSLGRLVGKDPKMLLLFDLIREVAIVKVPVLIEGESGTGKELVATAIHDLSSRRDKPFVAINCGALPEGILESELFGHVRGAFSGAVRHKRGRFELADGGTIFLDEIAELSLPMQVKLLRVLQEQQFERVGGESPVSVDVRVISATNQDLRRLMERKLFRRDLYYRLCVLPISVPPLRERRLDIPMLIEHFTELIAKESGRSMLVPSTEALDVLTQNAWPGNVRQLRNALEYAYVKCHSGIIGIEHLPAEVVEQDSSFRTKPGPQSRVTKDRVLLALAQAKGNKKEAAKILGIGRATLYRYLAEHGLN
jgi:sigma-54 dependent transcriptional regulator, acetoin dehydrogenase operon transcriptional activator AcoR